MNDVKKETKKLYTGGNLIRHHFQVSPDIGLDNYLETVMSLPKVID